MARLEEIEEDYGGIEKLIKESLQHEGEGLPGGLESRSNRSKKIA
jgi:hypothetical protein